MAEKEAAKPVKQPDSPPKTTRLGMWAALLAIVIASGVAYLGVYERDKRAVQVGPVSTVPAVPTKATPEMMPVAIGGPFSLTDHNGKAVTDEDFRGKFMLVMFGYTFCPDVCPTMLSTASDAIDSLGDKADQVTPIFITIDPARDTPENLKEYISYFRPGLVGLTGTADQISAVAKVYRVYYARASENKEDPGDYLMDHSALVYLMGPDGKFLAHFSQDTGADAMAARIRDFL